MHGSIDPRVLLRNELAQRAESGYDTAEVVALIVERGGPEALDAAGAQHLLDLLEQVERRPDWAYVEPENLESIRAECDWPDGPEVVELDAAYSAAVRWAWTGRIAGNMLGKPVEGFSRETIRALLEQVGAWPLSDYFPAPAPGEESSTPYIPCWTDTTRGRIDGSSRDDDVDYTILNLHVLRSFGADFSTDHVAATWLELLPYLQTYTAERVAVRNLVSGDIPTQAALTRNPYREFIGAAIRADVFGYVSPGDPGRAAELAYRDAALSHRANGVYSEMWCAALIAAAFAAPGPLAAIEESLRVVPRRSRLYEAVDDVRRSYVAGASWADVRDSIESRWGEYSWVHAVNNAAVVAAGVLYGAGDFGRTIALTVVAGLDTDSNGGTAGSVGALLAGRVDARWAEPLHDLVRSAVFGYDRSTITALAERTVEVARAFRSTEPAPTAPRDPISRDLW
jgi:ADP-ribosylglycohydrolase